MGRRGRTSEKGGAKSEGTGEVRTGGSEATGRSEWFLINALDGRVFVCGSSKGMGEGVEEALVDVVMDKGNLNREDAQTFWDGKKQAGQYITVSFVIGSIGMEVLLLISALGHLVMPTNHFLTRAERGRCTVSSSRERRSDAWTDGLQ